MMEFTTISGNLITFKPSSISHFREIERVNTKHCVRVVFSNDCVDLDISYADFKGRLEDHERREYYNMEATRKL